MLREVLTVSALILAVLLVRAIFKNRVPKRMVYTLWLVVRVKLCLPGTLVSLPVLPAEEAAAPVQRVEIPFADRFLLYEGGASQGPVMGRCRLTDENGSTLCALPLDRLQRI